MSIFGFLFKRRPAGSGSGLKPRLSTRLAMSEPVRLVTPTGSEQPAILQDVSAGGACVRTHQRLRVGDQILLSMYFGLNQRYDIQAKIVYAKGGERGFHARYGMRFVWISDDDRFRLTNFVNERVSASQFGVRTFPASPHQGNIS
ncbi:MAG TPA: PilZ domain-containing protein [Candidatus Binatus sp.]|nr:PilZ domain-containing protein [Candidatus Binatus sp.]